MLFLFLNLRAAISACFQPAGETSDDMSHGADFIAQQITDFSASAKQFGAVTAATHPWATFTQTQAQAH